MSNCNNKKKCIHDCDDCNEECCFKHLKPITIDSLFDDDTCKKYSKVLEKAKKARNCFFAAKTAIFNFVNDVQVLSNQLICLTDNAIDLDNVENKYKSLLSNLSSSLYTSLLQMYSDNTFLINVAYNQIDGDCLVRPKRSNRLLYSHPCSIVKTILLFLPGVIIELNVNTSELKMRFYEPEYNSVCYRNDATQRYYDVEKEFILSPSLTDVNSSGTNNEESVFDYLDTAQDYLDEIMDYSNNANEPFYGNQIFHIMNYLDKLITSTENAHKFVVQLTRINNPQSCD